MLKGGCFLKNWILAVDKKVNNFEEMQKAWITHHMSLKRVTSMPEAIKLLTKIDFLLIMIFADNIEYLQHLKLMRDISPMPILIVSSKHNFSHKLEALQLGADEYLATLSTVEESIVSGRALIRRYTVLNRQKKRPMTIITYHEILICLEYRMFFLKGKEIELTRKEFDFLYLLFSSIGRIFTHEQIYRYVWGDDKDSMSENYAVWCLVARTRKKLRSTSDTIEYIQTVRDVGYRINMILE